MVDLQIKQGVFYVDGQATVLVTADYPYYRDSADLWKDRLQKLLDINVKIVTIYIPWRHHQLAPDQAPDFTGATQANRNVHQFLALCQELGLWVVAKPGPFIHAETNYGGLPDWVCPLINPAIEPTINAKNQPVLWNGARLQPDHHRLEMWPLPAPFDPQYLALVEAWYRQVDRDVLIPNVYPQGPIIALQIANEGIYSDGQRAPWFYDYSQSALNFFHDLLAETYITLDTYNTRHHTSVSSWDEIQPPRSWQPPAHPGELLSYVDWGNFQAEYMGQVYRLWGGFLTVDLPILVNLNPPEEADHGMDGWLTRVQPERWSNVHYGFTNWIGDVSANPSAYDRYLVAAKRAPGFNLEENWGFAKLYYGAAYEDASTIFYQTLLALAGGTNGYNIYTGVATAHWDSNIDMLHVPPYPDAAPITAEGEFTYKAEILKWLNGFLVAHGEEWLACVPQADTAWGIYLPYAYVAAWAGNDKTIPQCGRALRNFQEIMRRLALDYGLVNLETASLESLLKYPRLVLEGGQNMDRRVAEKLAEYAKRGGKLAMIGLRPSLDETAAPLDVLSSLATLIQADALEQWLAAKPAVKIVCGRGEVWARSHPDRDVHYVVVLVPADADPQFTFDVALRGVIHRLEMSMTPSGGAILRIENGTITDAIVKGINGYLGQAISAACTLDGQQILLDAPGDIVLSRGELKPLGTPEPVQE